MATPLFSWLNERSAGVIMHPTSLEGEGGVGVLGANARKFVDYLDKAGIKYWQVLPLGPTGYGDSPYQSFSAFAGNPYMIDTSALIEAGLLEKSELKKLNELSNERVYFGGLYNIKLPLLKLAAERFYEKKLKKIADYGAFSTFIRENREWLNPYAAFMALKDYHDGLPWQKWDASLRSWKLYQETKLNTVLDADIKAQKFIQYLFFSQWKQIRKYANSKGVEIIGDMPIFVSMDSADTWTNQEVFQLHKDGSPKCVAGVPPDYFSELGQLWGNPLYRWNIQKKDGYSWWMKRLEMSFKLYDVLRIDHFRAFDTYWEIPANAPDARTGTWKKGPGLSFFKQIKKQFPEAKIIAEDLGEIPDSVTKLLENTGLPGMAILHFAFDGSDDNKFLPHMMKENQILYPGSHDNDTTVGWWCDTITEETKNQVRNYLNVDGNEIVWDFIRAGYKSAAGIFIVQMQDILCLDKESRMNTPGEAAGNWQWRMNKSHIDRANEWTDYLRQLGLDSSRSK